MADSAQPSPRYPNHPGPLTVDGRWQLPPVGPPDEWPVEAEFQFGKRTGLMARLESYALRLFFTGVIWLPERAHGWLVAGLARLARRLDARHADAGRRFLIQAFGTPGKPGPLATSRPKYANGLTETEREALLLESFRHFFRAACDTERFLLRVPFEKTFEHVRVHLCPRAEEVLRSGVGAVPVSPHVGSWEVASLLLSRMGLSPLYAVAKPVKNRFLSQAMFAAREKRGLRILPRRGAMAAAPKIIAAGAGLGLLLDQRANSRPIFAPFLGRRARCDRSAGVLVRRMKAPVLLLACYRTPDQPTRFELTIPEVIEPEEIAGLSHEGIATRLNQCFERMIEKNPEQYFWLHDRYKDTPLDELTPAEPPVTTPENRPGGDSREPDVSIDGSIAKAPTQTRETPQA